MSRTSIDEQKRKIFGARFTDAFQKWQEEGKQKGETRTQASFGKLLDPPASRGSVMKWCRGDNIPTPDREKQIRKIFGVPDDHFNTDNATHDELYKYGSAFASDLGRGEMSEFCKDIGLDLWFLYIIRKLIGSDFDNNYPTWTEIIPNPNIMSDQTYIRRDPTSWSDQAEMDEDVRVLQHEINDGKGGKKLIPFTREDLRFLKEVQGDVVDYVEYLMMKRSKDLVREVEEANRRSRIETKDGGLFFKHLTPDELNQIDKYHDYHYRYASKKEGK